MQNREVFQCELGGERSEDDSINSSSDTTNTDRGESSRKGKMDTSMSHRHIEKKRRDRINKTLLQLKGLVPSAVKKFKDRSGGRVEKAELLEMTIDYLKQLQEERKTILHAPQLMEFDGDAKPGLTGYTDDRYIQGFKDGVTHVLKNMREVGSSRLVDTRPPGESCCFQSSSNMIRPRCGATTTVCTLHDLADVAVQRQNATTHTQTSDVHDNTLSDGSCLKTHVTEGKSINVLKMEETGASLKNDSKEFVKESMSDGQPDVEISASVNTPLVAKVAPITTQSVIDLNQVSTSLCMCPNRPKVNPQRTASGSSRRKDRSEKPKIIICSTSR